MSLGKSDTSITKRLSKLREMRETLCQKESSWKEAFDARDWIVGQLHCLQNMLDDPASTMQDAKDRVSDILCALDPEEKSDDK